MSAEQFTYREPCEISEAERETYLAFAIELAERAGDAIRPYFRPDVLEVDNKLREGYDPVTQADRAAEEMMRRLIADKFPDHGVLGEEFGYAPGKSATWVLDPIDGTRAFVMGFLHWGTLVALFDGRRPIVGALHQPYLKETFAGDSKRAFRCVNGYGNSLSDAPEQALRTRSCRALGDALCASTSPDMFTTEEERRGFARVRSLARDMRFGTDCYAYAMLAMGQVDLVIEASLKPYDVQALIPIVEGAGGVITNWQGGNAVMGGAVVASGDKKLHQQVLQEIQS